MAQKTTITLTDDLDGTGAAESVIFGLDNATYEIDLSEENATTLREALAPFVANARRAGGKLPAGAGKRTGASSRPDGRTKAIREWARANGHQVADRGRLDTGIIEAYDMAHATT